MFLDAHTVIFCGDIRCAYLIRMWCCFPQFASGAFQHIKDTVLSSLNREPTVDISPDTAGTLSLIMLAQAQEVFFLKATRGM